MSVDDSTLNRIILECVAEFRLKYYENTDVTVLQGLIDKHLNIIHKEGVETFKNEKTPDYRRTLIRPYIERYIEGIKYYILIFDVDNRSNKFFEWDFRLQKRIENHTPASTYSDRWRRGGKSRKSKRRHRRTNRRTNRR